MTTPDPYCLELVALLRSTDCFRRVHERTLRELAAEMVLVSFQDDQTLDRQGEAADTLYVVIDGALAVTAVDNRGAARAMPDVVSGDFIGEANVLSPAPAAVTLRTRGAVLLAALSHTAFERFSERCPGGALEIVEALEPRLRRHRLWLALHMSDLFRHVEAATLAELESEFESVALYGGELLFREGDPGDSLYIVISGRLRIVTTVDDGREKRLAELGVGETVGEMAIISGERRSATVYASRDTQLAQLSRDAVERVLDRHPRPMLALLSTGVVTRLRNTLSPARRDAGVATVALVPHSPGVPLSEFAQKLASSFARMGATVHVSSDVVDRSLCRAGAAQAHDREGGATRLVEWLARHEVDHRFVVYEADPVLSPWTERCIRQADAVVIVADAATDAAAGEIEQVLLADQSQRIRQTLALVYRDGESPSGTARWFAGRTLERHLHVRLAQPGDFDRVARFLAGTTVGLALGGGFARGLAHLGVIRAFQELDIPIDAVGGASMGALVGAQWDLGWSASRIVDETCGGLAASFDDMTMPFLSFKRGGKYSRLIRGFYGDTRIEDLWIPFFCVSANLNRAELKVHTTGPLAEAVLASTRAPGIFPPLVIEGELHVDGGLINNVPVDVMKGFSNGGMVIGVDVSPPHELYQVANYGEDVSGWRAMWHRFHPTRDKRVYHPSILLVLMRVIEFGGISYRRQKAESADVYIAPEVLKYKRNDFQAAAGIAEAGYTAARARLIEWLASAPNDVRAQRPDLFARSP